jgi:hypothetical protein
VAFVKGQSGNPSGRPKLVEGQNMRELARAQTPAAIKTLADIMGNEELSEAARVSAANSLLDRAWGRPAQTLGDGDGNPLEWVDLIKAAQGRLAPLPLAIAP